MPLYQSEQRIDVLGRALVSCRFLPDMVILILRPGKESPMKKFFMFFLCNLIIFVLVSCSSQGKDNSINSPIHFDADYLNQQIYLIADENMNSFKINDWVGLMLIYNTTNEISFPDNYNLRIFIRKDDDWLEIYEKPTIRSGNTVILSPNIPMSNGRTVTFIPSLDDTDRSYQVRAYVFGDMNTKKGIHQVAAYIDFKLNP